MKIEIIENKTVQTRLTITVDGCIRIKIAIGTDLKDKKLIIELSQTSRKRRGR